MCQLIMMSERVRWRRNTIIIMFPTIYPSAHCELTRETKELEEEAEKCIKRWFYEEEMTREVDKGVKVDCAKCNERMCQKNRRSKKGQIKQIKVIEKPP